MLTPLEKALGLQAPVADALMLLALKSKCAGDSYYFNMDQATYDHAMQGDEEEDYYRFYTRQRAIGVDEFKVEVAQELAACSGIALHEMIREHNYDSGTWLLIQIVTHPQCEFATALRIYWANQPNFFYAKYENLEEASQDSKSFTHESAMLLYQIEKRTASNRFAQTLPVPSKKDLIDFLDNKNPDYTKNPYDKIPLELRI